MQTVIRKPNPWEKADVQTMWAECFPEGGPRFVDWYFASVYDAGSTLGMFGGGELLSNLQMIPYTLMLRKRLTAMDTLTGVATGAAHRNRGYAKTLMAEALRDMAARGRGFTFLYPFNHQFYQRLGWETCSVSMDCRKPADELPAVLPDGWQAHAAEPDIAVLSGVYERFIGSRNCHCVRDAGAWRKRIDENAANNGFLLLAYYLGEPAGYAFCEELEAEINVGEMACTRIQATDALLSALGPRGKPVCWTAPVDGRAYLLPGCWMDRVKLQPYVMFRVVDVPLAFRQAAPACDGAFVIEIRNDAMRPENNGIFRVAACGGEARAEHTSASPQFSCGVGALARILTGFMDASQAVSAGLAEGEREAVDWMTRMYPRQRNFLFELY